jgi:hypothetical protein
LIKFAETATTSLFCTVAIEVLVVVVAGQLAVVVVSLVVAVRVGIMAVLSLVVMVAVAVVAEKVVAVVVRDTSILSTRIFAAKTFAIANNPTVPLLLRIIFRYSFHVV